MSEAILALAVTICFAVLCHTQVKLETPPSDYNINIGSQEPTINLDFYQR